jgi:DNA modification methylase
VDGLNLESLGFATDELAALFNQPVEGKTDPDDVPDVQSTPVSAIGDIWLLGGHRIACGSCTDAHTVEAVLAGSKPHLMVTDPPYGVEYSAAWRDDALGGKDGGRATGKVENDGQADWRDAWALFPGDVAYVWHSERFSPSVAGSLNESDFEMRNLIVWAKSQLVIGRGHYHSQHETCWYAVRKGATGHWHGDRKQTTLWSIPKPQKSETGHSTQKPIECMKRPIENNSAPGDLVYEPFSGSGTTIIAAEMTGRKCMAIELNPAYVDVAIRRWQDFTGKLATLESDGRTFDEHAAERATP